MGGNTRVGKRIARKACDLCRNRRTQVRRSSHLLVRAINHSIQLCPSDVLIRVLVFLWHISLIGPVVYVI